MPFRKLLHAALLLSFFTAGCQKSETSIYEEPDKTNPARSAASLGIIGNSEDISTETKGGIVLMGGSTDVDDAIAWMIEQSGGGNFVVIRATGTDAYNPYIKSLGNIHSVETLKINSTELANDSAVVQTIRNAEALFIAGGDQSDYIRYWKDTKTADAINYLVNIKKAPVGGTSAGCAILGEVSFSALNGTITSEEALNNPFSSKLTLQYGGFINVPYLQNLITDQHYLARNREGRHLSFMARMADTLNNSVKGIGVDERTAVAIDSSGKGIVFGESSVLFLSQTMADKDPEVLEKDTPLTWNYDAAAIKGYEITESTDGKPQFNLKNWSPIADKESFYFYIYKGKLKIAQ